MNRTLLALLIILIAIPATGISAVLVSGADVTTSKGDVTVGASDAHSQPSATGAQTLTGGSNRVLPRKVDDFDPNLPANGVLWLGINPANRTLPRIAMPLAPFGPTAWYLISAFAMAMLSAYLLHDSAKTRAWAERMREEETDGSGIGGKWGIAIGVVVFSGLSLRLGFFAYMLSQTNASLGLWQTFWGTLVSDLTVCLGILSVALGLLSLKQYATVRMLVSSGIDATELRGKGPSGGSWDLVLTAVNLAGSLATLAGFLHVYEVHWGYLIK